MAVSLMSLWVPILVAAVLVFVVSSVIHMMLKYHQTDFLALPGEAQAMEALRPLNIPPGDYVIPHAGSMEVMKTPEFQAKAEAGPVMFVTVLPNGVPGMGASLLLWFVYCIVVGLFAGYVGSRTLAPGTGYLEVFQATGTVAFAGYGLALLQGSIWYKRKWSATWKSVFDALIYGLVTGGTFGWLWP